MQSLTGRRRRRVDDRLHFSGQLLHRTRHFSFELKKSSCPRSEARLSYIATHYNQSRIARTRHLIFSQQDCPQNTGENERRVAFHELLELSPMYTKLELPVICFGHRLLNCCQKLATNPNSSALLINQFSRSVFSWYYNLLNSLWACVSLKCGH